MIAKIFVFFVIFIYIDSAAATGIDNSLLRNLSGNEGFFFLFRCSFILFSLVRQILLMGRSIHRFILLRFFIGLPAFVRFVPRLHFFICRFFFDGVYRESTDDNGAVKRVRLTVSPGPHSYVFKVNPRNYGSPGSITSTARFPLWQKHMGFAIDTLGRNSTNSLDYVFPENVPVLGRPGGDGSLFTLDTRDTGDFTADELLTAARSLVYSNIVAKAGTTLDLGEGNRNPLPVRTFTGVTTVLNGGLNVCGQLKLATSDIENGGCLTVDGKLTFGAGARLVFDDEGGRKLKGRPAPFTVITARDGIEDLPEVDYDGDRWRFAVSADGKSLVATYIPPGALIIVK